MNVLLLDTSKPEPQIIDTEGGLNEWYRLIGCNLIDITVYEIDGQEYDFIFDDEGLFQERAKPTVLTAEGEPLNVGNIVICKCDEEGAESGLNVSDIEAIRKHLVILTEKTDQTDREPE